MFLYAYLHFVYLLLLLMGSKWSVGPHFEQHLFLSLILCIMIKVCVCCFLNRYASSIDDILEDEEHYADQLKEYLFYAEALR